MKVFGMELNREELAIGAVFGASFTWFIHPGQFATVPLCALLWALSGAGAPKVLRRLMAPLLIAAIAANRLESWIPLLAVLPAFGVLSLGYGIPTIIKTAASGGGITSVLQTVDEGSRLGRFVYNYLAGQDEVKANIITRFIYFLLLGIAFVPLAWFGIVPWLIGLAILSIGGVAAVLIVE